MAAGLGVKSADIRVGFASISTTVGDGVCTSTHMVGVGHHGVNMRINHRVREICAAMEVGEHTPEEVEKKLLEAKRITPKHHKLLNVFAAGLACAAFGRLLGADAPAFVTTLIASMIGQYIRLLLLERHYNAFVVTATVAFAAAVLSGLGAMAMGSTMIDTSMSAAVLMLVPGVPSMNAQTDIMEGFPRLAVPAS
nr:threonine/serine exporter family protein [Marinicella sp. W31]MDC2876914.1 threonine/serine exporter family protein [Marinicella sp. W31]